MAIPTIGAIPTVIDGTDILTDWGNAVGSSAAGRTVGRFVTRAARDAAITAPVEGMVAAITADPSGAPYLTMVQSGAWRPLLTPRQVGHIRQAPATTPTSPIDRPANLGTAVPVQSLVTVWGNAWLGFASASFTGAQAWLYTNQATAPIGSGADIAVGPPALAAGPGAWVNAGSMFLQWVIAAAAVAQVISRVSWVGGGAGLYSAWDLVYAIYDAPAGGPIPTTTAEAPPIVYDQANPPPVLAG